MTIRFQLMSDKLYFIKIPVVLYMYNNTVSDYFTLNKRCEFNLMIKNNPSSKIDPLFLFFLVIFWVKKGFRMHMTGN